MSQRKTFDSGPKHHKLLNYIEGYEQFGQALLVDVLDIKNSGLN